ncbi:MAG: VTT domain-containing protein [Dehalococcoidia bacterium]|nr:VTT domain-containing protein [Dehalococcoidia bacterium]
MPEDVTSQREQTTGEKPTSARPFLKPSKRDIAVAVAAVALFVGLTVLAYVFRGYLEHIDSTVRNIGYPAVFLISFLSSASVFLPLPGPVVVLVGGSVLSPVPVALVAALGAALGELTSYAMGYGGHAVAQNTGPYKTISGWMRKRGWPILFLLAAIPNPVFDAAGIAAGVLRYPVWLFFVIVLAGQIVKFLAFAFAGALGLPMFLYFLDRRL